MFKSRLQPICLILLFLFSACAAPEVQPLRFNAAPWTNGESHEFNAFDLNGERAGTLRFDVTSIGENAWSIRREIVAQGTQEIVVVEAAEPGFRPTSSLLVRIDNEGREQVRSTYNRGQVDIQLTTKREIVTYERVNIPSDARDQRTLFMLLRALPLAQGYSVRINTFLPVASLLDHVTIVVDGQEQVETPAGSFTAWHVELSTGDSVSEAWIGVDAPFPLIKFIEGRNRGTFELAAFTPGD
jgi:hypothetical protein